MKYRVGDKVLIKSKEFLLDDIDADPSGYMAEEWGGKEMTIRERIPWDNAYYMEEDRDTHGRYGGWCWYDHMIEGLVTTINIPVDELLDFIKT